MLREYSGRNSKGADKKAMWMAQYEETLTDAYPELAGHVDWDSATYLYLTGVDARAAAQRHIERQRNGGDATEN